MNLFQSAWPIHRVFLRRSRDTIRVPRIENRVPTIRENHHRVLRIKENRVPIIREIGTLQVHIGYLTFSFKKNLPIHDAIVLFCIMIVLHHHKTFELIRYSLFLWDSILKAIAIKPYILLLFAEQYFKQHYPTTRRSFDFLFSLMPCFCSRLVCNGN